MARKFFNQKVKKAKKKINTTTYIIIGGIVLAVLIVISVFIIILNNNRHKDAVIKLRDNLAVEVNTGYPDKTLFFYELENVKEKDIKVNYKNVDLKEVGKYNLTLKIYGKKYKTTLEVVDTESPTLEAKDYAIAAGEEYSPKDFVANCTDNSGKECIIEFYKLSLDQDGKEYDFGSFTKEGTYTIQIVAKDESGNSTVPVSAKLSIGEKQSKPISCKYGNSDYDNSKYNLAINVTDNGCALDLNLYQNDNIVAPVKSLLNAEEEKLKKEFSKIKVDTKTLYLNSNIAPVLNITGKGIVGYTLYIEVSIQNTNGEKEVIESYYLNQSGNRDYIVNKYLK